MDLSTQRSITNYPSCVGSNPTQIPVLVSRILSYLPPSDLLTCTRVNSVWEAEARKYLLKNVPTRPLCCSQMFQYFQDMAARGHIHDLFKLSICLRDDCLSNLVAKLAENSCLKKVTSLTTPWVLDGEWIPNFKDLRLLENLDTLEFRPPRDTSNYEELESQFTTPWTLPSIQTLIWNFIPVNDTETNYGEIVFKMLVNVTTMKCNNVMGDLIAQVLPFVSCNLTRLEFNLFQNSCPGWDEVMAKFAPTLEHLTIRGVSNIDRDDTNSLQTLVIPILPKLRVFRILRHKPRYKYVDDLECQNPEDGVPELELEFVTASQGCRLNYATQFPYLLKLEVGCEQIKVMSTCPLHTEASKAEYPFEAYLEFLYGTFLPPPSHTQEPCSTLRHLIIPVPPPRGGDVLQGMSCKKCNFLQLRRQGHSCSWEVEAQLFRRVEETFPNLENMGRYKHTGTEEEDYQERILQEEKVREWLEFGEKLGIVKGLEQLKG